MKPTDFARNRNVYPPVRDIVSMARHGAFQYGGAFNVPEGSRIARRPVSRLEQQQQARRNRLRFGLLFASGLLAAAMAGASFAQGALPAPQTSNGIEYVTGGFGDDMAEAFKSAQSEYPLALTFAEDAGGGSRPYLAEVDVSIKDQSGETVLEVPSTGPYFLAKLKPGKYRVEATHMGKTQTQNVTVGEGGSGRHVMTWKAQ